MFLLDNDIFNLAIQGDLNVERNIRQNIGGVWLSSIAAKESLTGRMSMINRSRSPHNSLSLTQAHTDFAKTLEDLRIFPLWVYDDAAELVFNTFLSATLRIGAQDCRIAAQAMAHGMVVVTRNVRDFNAIGATCLDWSAV